MVWILGWALFLVVNRYVGSNLGLENLEGLFLIAHLDKHVWSLLSWQIFELGIFSGLCLHGCKGNLFYLFDIFRPTARSTERVIRYFRSEL